eukprot:4734129-Pleurochrysis_carterae.AAC.2
MQAPRIRQAAAFGVRPCAAPQCRPARADPRERPRGSAEAQRENLLRGRCRNPATQQEGPITLKLPLKPRKAIQVDKGVMRSEVEYRECARYPASRPISE